MCVCGLEALVSARIRFAHGFHNGLVFMPRSSLLGRSGNARSNSFANNFALPWIFGLFRQPFFLALVSLLAYWLLFFNELRGEWRVNAQYSYGYFAPLLGAALIWRRWPDRPKPAAKESPGWLCFTAGALMFLQLPLRVIVEANPEWRLIYWIHGFQVIGLSFCLLYWLGGWRWVRFFAPPIVFMLIAVPWPMGFEQWATQGLMRLVAGLTVEVAGWFGIPAVQHGNVIETTAGLVGIDEACSGVRSLQSALMLSLFLGELYRFSAARRSALLGASLVFDLIANVSRTSFLVWAAANRSLAQMEAWHDTAGLLVMLIVLPSLLAMAHFLKPKDQPLVDNGGLSEPLVLPAISRWIGLSALLWIGATELTTEWWYTSHERDLIATPRWTVAWPTQQYRFRKTSLPENSLAILRCSASEAGVWEDGNGNEWTAFMLRWKPGKNSAQLAKGHRPDICLPAAGGRLLDEYGQISLPVHDFEIPFHHQAFELAGKVVHTFYCLWPDRVSRNEKPILEDGSQLSRFYAVLAGRRHLGQQVLELVIQGPESQNEAVALLKKNLPELISKE
jgi:exosortase